MSHKPAGGLHSRVVRHSSNPKSEPRSHARNPGAVAQYGQMQGTHVTHAKESDYRGDPDYVRKGYAQPVGPTSFSNIGPGGGRTVMKSGQQSCHGTPTGTRPRAGRPILDE
jgi:hypothetical protein